VIDLCISGQLNRWLEPPVTLWSHSVKHSSAARSRIESPCRRASFSERWRLLRYASTWDRPLCRPSDCAVSARVTRLR